MEFNPYMSGKRGGMNLIWLSKFLSKLGRNLGKNQIERKFNLVEMMLNEVNAHSTKFKMIVWK